MNTTRTSAEDYHMDPVIEGALSAFLRIFTVHLTMTTPTPLIPIVRKIAKGQRHIPIGELRQLQGKERELFEMGWNQTYEKFLEVLTEVEKTRRSGSVQ